MRFKLRTILLIMAVLGLLCWVLNWYLRRANYLALAEHHRAEAQSQRYRLNSEARLHRIASYDLSLLLAQPELDVRKNTTDEVRSERFHPFAGPRSSWPAAIEAHRQLLLRIAARVAYHNRMEKAYHRAFAAPWWVPPSEPPPPVR